MRRREFIFGVVGAVGVSALHLKADHHTVSADPLLVEFDLSSLESRYTQVEDFYVRNHFAAPRVIGLPALHISGEVELPQALTAGDLSRLTEHTIGAVLECAGNPVRAVSLVSDGVWRGWRLSDVIALSRPRSSGAYLHCFGQDGFSRSVPIDDALSCGLLVTALNRRPLTRNHGAPWRVVFPGWYAMNSVKWLKRIEVAKTPLPDIDNTYLNLLSRADGSVEDHPLPKLQVKSIITSPVSSSMLPRGKVLVRGIAWSGTGKIASVQVSADNGSRWTAAELDRPESRYDWTLWRTSIKLERTGMTSLVCRAVDEGGNIQPSIRDPQRMDGYADNAYHRIRCIVVA